MTGLNARQKCVVVLMDLLLLAELCVSVYLGQQNPEEITTIFLKTFVPAVVLTVFTARIAIRRLGDSDADPAAEPVAGRQ